MTEIEELCAGIALQTTQPKITPSYYLYYSNTGIPLYMSSDLTDAAHIEITNAQYNEMNLAEYSVQGKKLVKKEQPTALPKLVPSIQGTPCCSDDITLVTTSESDITMWDIKRGNNGTD